MHTVFLLLTVTLLSLSSVRVLADDDSHKGVCKITVKTLYVKGNTKVDVEEVPATDRKECMRLANERKINKNPDEIAKISSAFGFSSPE